MNRLLFNLLTALSLLLCTALTIAWVASYTSPRTFSWGDGRLGVGKTIFLQRGWFMFVMGSSLRPVVLRTTPDGDMETVSQVRRSAEEVLGVEISSWDEERSTEPGVSYGQHLQVSSTFTLPVFGTAVLPAWWMMRLGWLRAWRRPRRRGNRCAHCGYDLRATPTRCPECGAAARAPAAATHGAEHSPELLAEPTGDALRRG